MALLHCPYIYVMLLRQLRILMTHIDDTAIDNTTTVMRQTRLERVYHESAGTCQHPYQQRQSGFF